nr:DUF4183 domain-containing protein [Brevibacillus marinus]
MRKYKRKYIACKRRCQRKRKKILKTKVSYYYTVSNGDKRIFTDSDGIKGYGSKRIPDPKMYSLINLYINGVLQPPNIYKVKRGLLIIRSGELPQKGVPIILQFIRILQG